MVGLIVPDIRTYFFAQIATFLQSLLEEHGYRVILCASHEDEKAEMGYLRTLLQYQVDGIIYVPCSSAGAGAMMKQLERQVPVVELTRHSKSGFFDAVTADDYDGGWQLGTHLASLGHRRVAMIAGPEELSTTQDRVAGFREACARGKMIETPIILYGAYSEAWGERAFKQLMETGPWPTAIFASSTQIVIGVLKAAADLLVDIPGDISLAGYDDPDWYAIWHPPITTYASPLEEMGLAAARQLLARIHDRDRSLKPTRFRLSGQFLLRGSTASARASIEPMAIQSVPRP
ncbi:MAG: substrate-binding domain-containing protein [Candidatus Dormibacteraceae bacterium]